ncbi:MAG: peptidoglycan-associated lipoprotein Pal [Rhodobacteraceae bacterium]|nr:peptidoglycan-associated lipoprotein Pal [Paracoccaceae bacterium]
MRLVALSLACLVAVAACSPNETATTDSDSAEIGQAALEGIEATPFNSPEYLVQNIGDRVLFELDSSALTGEAEETLLDQAAWLRDNPQHMITVEGHADERGTREYNLALGARRSESVRSFLIQNGVQASRIGTVSYGKERPELPCSFEQCWSQNRRAVTVVESGG